MCTYNTISSHTDHFEIQKRDSGESFLTFVNRFPGINFNSLHAGYFFMLLLSYADFFSKLIFSKKFFQEHYQSVKRFWIQIRNNILSVLIWVQAVCKGYQQMTKNSCYKFTGEVLPPGTRYPKTHFSYSGRGSPTKPAIIF